AFLEARAWGDALGPLAAHVPRVPMAAPGIKARRESARARLSKVAAGLLAAFAAGWVARGGWHEASPVRDAPASAVVGEGDGWAAPVRLGPAAIAKPTRHPTPDPPQAKLPGSLVE